MNDVFQQLLPHHSVDIDETNTTYLKRIMNALQICLLVFVIIETLNMLELYFMQDKCVFNGICLFSGWDKSKEDPEVHRLVRYLLNWLAGMKMLVVGLVLVLIFTAPKQTLLLSAISMVITIGSFYWRMYPMISKADDEGQLKRKGRSRMLGKMVAGLQFSFIITIIIELVAKAGL